MPFLELNGQRREIPAANPGSGEGGAEAPLVVGSGAQAGWRITNADLAARHFTVAAHGGEVRVRPYSGQHVVVVNGEQVGLHGATLRHGDVVAAGNARFRYVEREGDSLPPAGGAEGPAWLVNERLQRAYELTHRSATIGRDAGSAIVVRDPMVSRFHADVRAEAGGFVLYSMGSAGTRVNGTPVSGPQMLQEGDRVGIGDTTLTFTRQALPAGVRVAADDDEPIDEEASRRATVVGELSFITGERDPVRRGPPVALWVAIALALMAIVYFIVLR